jgi:MFS family permease
MSADHPRAVVALACTAQFVDVVGVTVLIVALPMIQHDLGLDAGTLSWVAAAYALAFGGFLVAGGRAADLAGRRATFVAGSVLVAGGSLVCALAPNGTLLLAGRALQGLGAAVSIPAALAALLAAVPPGPRRGRALGIWTMAGGAGGAAGFVIGGVVTEYAGWRWLFAVIGPVALIAAGAGAVLLAPGRGARGGPLDVAGAALSTLAAVLLILGCNRAESAGFGDPWSWVPLLLSPGAVLVFVLVERRAADPLIPPAVWSIRPFRLGAGVAAVLTATTSGSAVIGSLFLQRVLDVSAAASGASFLLLSGGVVASSLAAPAVLRRLGPALAMALGLAMTGVALGAQALSVTQRSFPGFLAGLALSGLGLGVASMASTTYGTTGAGTDTAGLIGGLLNAAAQVGTAVGIAVLLVVAARWSGSAAEPAGQTAAYLVAAGAALLVAGYCAARHGRPGTSRADARAGSGIPDDTTASAARATNAGTA